MPDLLDVLDEAALRALVDSGALTRGRQVYDAGQVRRAIVTERSHDVLVIEAEVWGSAPEPYDVDLRVERRGDRTLSYRGYCTCPVRLNCKHTVASVLSARRKDVPRLAKPAWERTMLGLLEAVEPAPDGPSGRAALGLLLELKDDQRARRAPGPTVFLRPVRRTDKGTWSRTNIAWSSLGYASRDDLAHVRALQLVQRSAKGAYLHGARALLPAEEIGPGLWAMLQQVRDSGVALVTAKGEARLADEPVPPTIDLTRADDDLLVRLRVGERDEPAEIVLLGDPGHTVVVRGDDDTLEVARLTRPLAGPLRSMARQGSGLRIPRADEEQFLTGYLPRLGRHLALASSDGSVAIPEPPKPRLVLTVEWPSVATAQLSWTWRYGTGEQAEVFAPYDRSEVRDLRAESAIITELRGGLTDPARRMVLTASEALGTRQRVGPEYVLVLRPMLIEVEATGLVDLEFAQPMPDFREAQGTPEIRFEAGGTVPAPGDETDDRNDWLDLSVTLRVDGQSIPLASVLEALTRGQKKVFLHSGLYVSVDRPELEELADLVREATEISDREPGELRVGHHDLGRWAQLAELGIVDEQAAAWVDSARKLARIDELPVVEPIGLKHELRPYQLAGFRWLVTLWQCGLGGILADDMGLGKTLQALALITHAREAAPAGPFLVVAPTSVVGAWAEQARTHTPGLDVRLVSGLEKKRGVPLAVLAEGADVVVTSYALLRLEAVQYRALTWGGLIVDEAQMIKNHRGQTYDAVRRIEAPFRLAMTGTPFENRLLELWAILSVAAPGIYPWPEDFTEQVARPVERRGDEKALARFRTRIRPFLLRRTKELVAPELPPKQEQVLRVALGDRHRRVYDTHLQRERQKVLGLVEDFDRNRIAIFGALTRLRQLSLHAGLVDEGYAAISSAKLDLLVEQLHEVRGEGHRALVFSTFTGFLGKVRERLEKEGIATSYLDGSTRDRAGVVEGFRSGDDPVFLISLKAGGVGLTLTEADYVYVLDPWWNPAAEAQAVDRAHRIGQERPVFVYRLIAEDTIEEKVHELKERKAALFAQVLDGGGAGGAVLDADDVRSLFA